MSDDKTLQQNRIKTLSGEITPHGRVEFDGDKLDRITFRIVDINTGTVLAASGQLKVRELADRSDEWIRQYICHLGGGDI